MNHDNARWLEGWPPWPPWPPWLLALPIALWQIDCTAFDVFRARSPSRPSLETAGLIAAHAQRPFRVTTAGFGSAIVVGASVLLGFVIGSSRLGQAAMTPQMTTFNTLPKVAFVPVRVVWFGVGVGVGVGPAILTAFPIWFFPITVDMATGLAALEPKPEDVLRVLGAKRGDVLLKFWLPCSLPHVHAPLQVAITLACVGAALSEVTAASGRIGCLLLVSRLADCRWGSRSRGWPPWAR